MTIDLGFHSGNEVISSGARSFPNGQPPNPCTEYLNGLRAASRRVMQVRLAMFVRAANHPAVRRADGRFAKVDVFSFPWERLESVHVRTLSQRVVDGYAPSTARTAGVALRGVLRACWRCGFYDWAEYERRIDAIAPVEGERLTRGRALAAAEVTAMHRIASSRDRAMLALVFGGGLRRSEAAWLTWGRFDGATLRVLGKGARERDVPLPAWALASLFEWRAASHGGRGKDGAMERILRRARVRKARVGIPTAEGLLADGIYYALRTLAGRAGVEGVSPHDGRRTFISELLDVADTAVVAKLAGHASAEQTRRYDRRDERAGREAVARVRPLVG